MALPAKIKKAEQIMSVHTSSFLFNLKSYTVIIPLPVQRTKMKSRFLLAFDYVCLKSLFIFKMKLVYDIHSMKIEFLFFKHLSCYNYFKLQCDIFAYCDV